MAEKKSGTDKKTAEKTRAEAAEALKRAAELITSLNSVAEEPAAAPKKKTASSAKSASAKPAETKSAAKKPAAKKETDGEKPETTAAKKPAAKSTAKTSSAKTTAAKKPAAKSTAKTSSAKTTAARKPAAKSTAAKPQKAPVKKEEKTVEQHVGDEEVAATELVVAEDPVKETAAPSQEETAVKEEVAAAEQKTEEEPKLVEEEKPTEEKTEDAPPASEQTADNAETKEEPAVVAADTKSATEIKAKDGKRVPAAEKARKALDKGKLPIFIVINALFVVSAVLLLVSAFSITSYATLKTVNYNLFGYFQNAATVKDMLAHTSLSWSNVAFVVIGILMILATLLPLALVVKNVILLIVKKSKQVYKSDSIVTVSFMLAYLAIVGLFGANVSVGQIIAFIIALLGFAFTVLTLTLARSDSKIPFFSFAVIVGVIVSILLLSQTPVFNGDNGSWFAASASSEIGGAGALVFILVLVAVFALVAISLAQVKRLPKILQIAVPAAAVVCSLVALIVAAVSMSDGLSLGGGFVCGVVITCLTCIVNAVFVAIKPLNKFVVCIDGEQAEVAPKSDADAQTEVPANTETADPATTATEIPATADNVRFCPECGNKNADTAKFCYSCGKPLKKD